MPDGERTYPGMPSMLTIDIEDWQQSESDILYPNQPGVRATVPPGERVIANTRRLTDLLAEFGASATCFVLGTVAEVYPSLVRDLAAMGHEIAIHGYNHRPVFTMSPSEFRADVSRALATMQDCIGARVHGYRAPYFSITRQTPWALPILAELGLDYDASMYPCERVLYQFPGWEGWKDVPRYPHALQLGGRTLIELPATTLKLLGLRLPLAGGGFLRLAPVHLFRRAITQAHDQGHPAILYLHPHDLDEDSQVTRRAHPSLRERLLTWYLGLGRQRVIARLRSLLGTYACTTIYAWLAQAGTVGGRPTDGLSQPYRLLGSRPEG